MTCRSIGARVGNPRDEADPAGGICAIGVESGGPGSGGASMREVHHQPATAKAITTPMSAIFRIVKTCSVDAKQCYGAAAHDVG
jgi:hypothetical protein